MWSEKNVKNKINKNKTHIFTRYYIIHTIIMLEMMWSEYLVLIWSENYKMKWKLNTSLILKYTNMNEILLFCALYYMEWK